MDEGNRLEKRLLVSILILGFVLRLVGIQFGLPHLYHADEPIVVNHAMAYGTGDLNPHFFKIPPLVSYLLFPVYGFFYVFGRMIGWFNGTDDFLQLFVADPTAFYLLGRILFGAMAGTATIYLFYRLLKTNFSSEHAMLSSFFLATCFLHVRDSHYIYVDIMLLLLLVACFVPIFKIADTGETKDYLLFATLMGMATATKYNGVFILAPFLVAHLFHRGWTLHTLLDHRLLLVVILSFLVFVLMNPFVVLDFNTFLHEISIQAKATSFVGWLHHLTYSLNGSIGFPILVLAILNILLFLYQPEKRTGIIVSFGLGYYILLCCSSQFMERYVLPLVPFAIFLATDVVVRFVHRFSVHRAVALMFTVALAAPSMAKIYLSNQLFIKTDIRTVASQWIRNHIPPGSKIALDASFLMPPLKMTLSQLKEKRSEAAADVYFGERKLKKIEALIKHAGHDKHPRYELFFLKEDPNIPHGFMFSKPHVPYDIDELIKREISYVIVSKDDPMRQDMFYHNLRERSLSVKKFSPYKNKELDFAVDRIPLTGGPFRWADLVCRERNGHMIEVYQLPRI